MWQQRRKRRRTHAGLGKKGSGQKGCGTFLHQAGLHTHTGTGKELDHYENWFLGTRRDRHRGVRVHRPGSAARLRKEDRQDAA